MKTNGARFLESLGIPFELREYEVDPDDLSAITVAKKIGMPPEQVFKTLLVTGGPNVYRFAVVPGDAELDFKKLARAAGLRKAEMAPLKDVQPLTGYIRGGVTLFGSRKVFPVYIDETAILFDKISVSAGTRGTQLILSPDDYLKADRRHHQGRPKADRGGTLRMTAVLQFNTDHNVVSELTANLGAPSMATASSLPWVGYHEPQPQGVA
jgi:Cys-tRNA(Pro)/Cys-tRNA(Cys) deacylase